MWIFNLLEGKGKKNLLLQWVKDKAIHRRGDLNIKKEKT